MMAKIDHWAVPIDDHRYDIVVDAGAGDWRVAGGLLAVNGRQGHPTVFVTDDGRQFTGSDPAAEVIRHVCARSTDPVVRALAR